MLGRLEEDRDATAVAPPERLQDAKPERFSRVHLRTLQRRVQKWRSIMAGKLVYAGSGGIAQNKTCDLPELELEMGDLKS